MHAENVIYIYQVACSLPESSRKHIHDVFDFYFGIVNAKNEKKSKHHGYVLEPEANDETKFARQKLWNCINFEMACCHIAMASASPFFRFFFFWLDINIIIAGCSQGGHERDEAANSMWHKMKLLVPHEYFKALF